MLYFEKYAKVKDVLELKKEEGRHDGGVVKCPMTVSLSDLISYMDDCKVGAVYLEDQDGDIKGVVSERDIIHQLALYDLKAFEKPISSFMGTDILSCAPEDSLKQVASFMAEKGIRHIAVKDHDGTFVGVVSARDIERFAGNG